MSDPLLEEDSSELLFVSQREKDTASQRVWRSRNPERHKAIWDKFADTHRERRRAYEQAYRKSHQERIKGNRYQRKYKVTWDEVQSMVREQGNQCKICGAAFGDTPSTRYHVDHCHKAGHVRGILCNNCNKGIGHFKENHDLLAKATEYLRKTGTPQ